MVLSFLGITTSMNGQVRIGGDTGPDKSAVLDLNKTDDPAPAGNLGLSLPRVNLQTIGQELATDETPKNGTVVYNTSDKLDGQGIYVWTDTKWLKVNASAAPVITGQPKAFSFSRLIDTNGDPKGPATATIADLSVTATGDGLTYQWYEKATNKNAPDTEVGTDATYSPDVTAWGMRSYYVVVSDANGNSVTSDVADVAIGCGAKTVTGGWLKFMCYNLGSVDTQLDPFTFASGNLGAFHQWGRQGAADRTNTDVNWTNAPKYPYDWKLPNGYDTPLSDTYHSDDYLWGTLSSGYDPCPSGWHVPSQTAFAAIFNGTADADEIAHANANTWVKSGGLEDFTDYEGGVSARPDGTTTTLYFPAAGYRHYYAGVPMGEGFRVDYWSGSTYGTLAYHLYVSADKFYPAEPTLKGYGLSVRCIFD
ncbi:hypothetical protein FACS189474_1980 [Bacteroidia bacterium]|nr:hypothetical protein FACS189474_1980 [Bacteroidia bacterium]